MAWVSMGQTSLVEGGYVRGYVYFEYDDTSTARACRLRIVKTGYETFTVSFRSITVDGVNYGDQYNLTENSGTFWTGNLAGGQNHTASWTIPWWAGTQYASITGYLPSAYTPPTGLTATFVSQTWNSVTGTVSITSYGVPSSVSGRYVEFGIVPSTSTSYGTPYRYDNEENVTSATITITNSSPYAGSFVLTGMTPYKIGAYATNTQATTRILNNTIYYTPPAPGTMSMSHVEDTTTYTITYIGDVNNYYSGYDVASYSKNFRYRIDGGAWTTLTDSTPIDTAMVNTITVPYGSVAEIEAWQTYHGNSSVVSTMTISNTGTPARLYGSVNGQSKRITTLYGSVNGQTKKIVKLYASVNGRTKRIF